MAVRSRPCKWNHFGGSCDVVLSTAESTVEYCPDHRDFIKMERSHEPWKAVLSDDEIVYDAIFVELHPDGCRPAELMAHLGYKYDLTQRFVSRGIISSRGQKRSPWVGRSDMVKCIVLVHYYRPLSFFADVYHIPHIMLWKYVTDGRFGDKEYNLQGQLALHVKLLHNDNFLALYQQAQKEVKEEWTSKVVDYGGNIWNMDQFSVIANIAPETVRRWVKRGLLTFKPVARGKVIDLSAMAEFVLLVAKNQVPIDFEMITSLFEFVCARREREFRDAVLLERKRRKRVKVKRFKIPKGHLCLTDVADLLGREKSYVVTIRQTWIGRHGLSVQRQSIWTLVEIAELKNFIVRILAKPEVSPETRRVLRQLADCRLFKKDIVFQKRLQDVIL